MAELEPMAICIRQHSTFTSKRPILVDQHYHVIFRVHWIGENISFQTKLRLSGNPKDLSDKHDQIRTKAYSIYTDKNTKFYPKEINIEVQLIIYVMQY